LAWAKRLHGSRGHGKVEERAEATRQAQAHTDRHREPTKKRLSTQVFIECRGRAAFHPGSSLCTHDPCPPSRAEPHTAPKACHTSLTHLRVHEAAKVVKALTFELRVNKSESTRSPGLRSLGILYNTKSTTTRTELSSNGVGSERRLDRRRGNGLDKGSTKRNPASAQDATHFPFSPGHCGLAWLCPKRLLSFIATPTGVLQD
jgi:hypothetical protein